MGRNKIEILKQVKQLDPSVKKVFTSLLTCYIEEIKDKIFSLKHEDLTEAQGAGKKLLEIILDLERAPRERNEYKSGAYDGEALKTPISE